MTELEAKNILERNWWKTFGGNGPDGVLMAVGDLYEEDEGNYWFYAARYANGEMPPADMEEWEVWGVGKAEGHCGLYALTKGSGAPPWLRYKVTP